MLYHRDLSYWDYRLDEAADYHTFKDLWRWVLNQRTASEDDEL